MSESEIENTIRTILGTISFIGIWICIIICCYKYAVCQEKQNKVNNLTVIPRTYNTTDTNKNMPVILL